MAENDTTGWQTPGGPGLKCFKGGRIRGANGFTAPWKGKALRRGNNGD